MKLRMKFKENIMEIELNESLSLLTLKSLMEAEFKLPVENQLITYNSVPLTDNEKALETYNIVDNSLLIISHIDHALSTNTSQQTTTVATQPPNTLFDQSTTNGNTKKDAIAIEILRKRILSDETLAKQLKGVNPELLEAATNSPEKFAKMTSDLEQQRYQAELQKMLELEALNADPFNIEAQKRIEELIRSENVMKNMEHAMEYNPESFANVSMLYIDTVVNNHHVKAFVDSGAQVTIMNTSCAEKCGLMRLLDTRFSGIAKGVGTAKILGRIHNAVIKVGNQFLACSFTVMEGNNVELLFGLDMLKKHQACIDLKKNALIINDEAIKFLPEYQIPTITPNNATPSLSNATPNFSNATSSFNNASSGSVLNTPLKSTVKDNASTNLNTLEPMFEEFEADNIAKGKTLRTENNKMDLMSSSVAPILQAQPRPAASLNTEPPLPIRNSNTSTLPATSHRRRYSENNIESLINLGFTRERAIIALDAADGNVDMAAGFLFD
ncbi:hypothetical protein BB561_001400 [Smittium simulii]|uniref:DNA damage-inducible protein 1 n=1 Tax=Smittium simulii TaxID=133385 RepID=A0A2T9YUY0_9FUNG|nr:hypothetical protein BB561_001400 [Smittium simulii]